MGVQCAPEGRLHSVAGGQLQLCVPDGSKAILVRPSLSLPIHQCTTDTSAG